MSENETNPLDGGNQKNRKWPADILLLASVSACLWCVTLAWHVFDLDQRLRFNHVSEGAVWLGVLSGLFYLFLLFAAIVRVWALILAISTWLFVVNLCLVRLSAKKRWLITIAVSLLVFPALSRMPALQSLQATNFVSTAVFDYNCRQIRQANSIRCSVAGSGLSGVLDHSRADGDRHWLKQDDGSIIIFPDYQSCSTELAPEQQLDVLKGGNTPESQDDVTLVFDSSDNPTKVDVYSPAAFAVPEKGSLLRSVTLARSDSQPTPDGLAKAFPGMERFLARRGEAPSETAAASRVFIGLAATATHLAPNTDCGAKSSSGVVLLPPGNRCIFFNDCDKSGPTIVCGQGIGNLRVDFDPSFATARLKADAPDHLFRETLYDSQRIPSTGPTGEPALKLRGWLPEICLEKVCGRPDSPSGSMAFYLPAKRLLIELRITQRVFGRASFSQQWP
jgi:hypothetical protein